MVAADTLFADDVDALLEGGAFDAEDYLDPVESAGLVRAPALGEDELLDALYEDLHRGEQAKAVLAEREMARVIEATSGIEHGLVEGLGQCIARIPLSVFHHWGSRYGYEIWNDPQDLLAFLAKRNPGLMIKAQPRAFRGAAVPSLPAGGATTAAPVRGLVAAGEGATGAAPAVSPAPTGALILP
jgi:hypothetical protein